MSPFFKKVMRVGGKNHLRSKTSRTHAVPGHALPAGDRPMTGRWRPQPERRTPQPTLCRYGASPCGSRSRLASPAQPSHESGEQAQAQHEASRPAPPRTPHPPHATMAAPLAQPLHHRWSPPVAAPLRQGCRTARVFGYACLYRSTAPGVTLLALTYSAFHLLPEYDSVLCASAVGSTPGDNVDCPFLT